MSYITKADLLEELGEDILVQLTDNEETGEINDSRIEKSIEYARGVFDAYARTRYSLPVPVTPMVKAVCLDLAIFHLYKSRTSIAEGVYEIRKNANDEAIKLLTNISNGKAALDVPAITETKETPASSDSILTNAGKSTFTDTALKGY